MQHCSSPASRTDDWLRGWPGCHHEDAGNKLSILKLGTAGKGVGSCLGITDPAQVSWGHISTPGSKVRREHSWLCNLVLCCVCSWGGYQPLYQCAVRMRCRRWCSCAQLCCTVPTGCHSGSPKGVVRPIPTLLQFLPLCFLSGLTHSRHPALPTIP